MATLQPVEYQPADRLQAPYTGHGNFPLALSAVPASDSQNGTPSISSLTEEVAHLSSDNEIRALLDAHGGAIFFPNLGLRSPDEFSAFAGSFGWKAHEDIGNPVRRTIIAPNVATANEGPNTKPVYPHNEFGLSPHYPAYVLFYCEKAPESGGETPINNSIVLYQKLKETHPEFIEEVEKKGVKYQLFYPNSARDQTASPGNSVLQAYGAHVLDSDDTETARQKIESEIRRLPTATWAWENQSESNPLGDLRVWQILPAVRKHSQTGHQAFFNNVVSRFLNAVVSDTLEPPHVNSQGKYQPPAFYGDGSLIPKEYLETAVKVINETRVLVSWKEGDVLLLDNHAVQHAREPWTGSRRLLASLWDEP